MAPACLPSETLTKLDALLVKAAEVLPGTFFVVTSPEAILYSNQTGKHDVLKSAGADNTVQEDSVLWFASTTKLLTSVAILQLVEKGLLTLDTPVDEWLPEMAKLKIISEWKDGEPIFVEPQAKITIQQMLNQTSGVGAEMSPRIQAWKKWTKVGGGYVNSCKVENLVNTPLTEEPGTRYQYGNSAEWLGLLIARLTGGTLEDYFQANIFGPLGLPPLSTFYPHSTEELRKKVMPIRFWDEEKQEYQALVDQVDLLKLPRETKDIEYPVAGGGIYTPPRSYALVLQSLLSGSSLLLSRPSMDSLFESTLPTEQSRADLAEMVGPMSNMKWAPGDVDWSTGLCVWHRRKEDGEGKPWGRLEGSAGWAGAANTMYWVDRKAEIACVFSSNLLPFNFPPANEICAELERVVYEALGF